MTTDLPTITMLATDQLVSFQNIRAADRAIDALAESLKRVGVLEPLLVIPDEANDARWVIVAGNRRHAAAKKAGITTLPCIVRTDIGTDLRMVETQLAENLQRDPLTLKEETLAFEKLTLAGMSPAEIGKVAGRGKASVASRLTFLDLPDTTKAKVWDGQITLEEAEVLASFADEPDAVAWLEKYVGSSSFAWQKNNWTYEKERRTKAEAERARKAAEKAALKEATAAAKASGQPAPKPPKAPEKPAWQVEQDKRKERENAIVPLAATAHATREPWVRNLVTTEAKRKTTLPGELRGLLLAAADSILNSTILDLEVTPDVRSWIGISDKLEVDVTTLTDAQLIVLAALTCSVITEPLEDAWEWMKPDRAGPLATKQLVQFLGYPISPEEQALADGGDL